MNVLKNLGAWRRAGWLFLVALLLLSGESFGQTPLKTLLDQAEANYPGIAAKLAKAEALKTKAALERNSAIPSLDAFWQVNYATYNNITGMTAPGTLFPISGPPSSGNNYEGVPGSAAALTLKWSPVTFGQRSASVDYAEKMYERQLTEVSDEVLRIQSRVAVTYLNLVTLEQLTAVHRKNLERSLSNLEKIRALSEAGLRPSVDSLQFLGEVSKARTELFKMENLFESAKFELQELLASSSPVSTQTDDLFFSRLPFLPSDGAGENTVTPQLAMAKQELEANKSLLRQISRSWTPRLDLFGTTFARGSGIGFDGTVDKPEGWTFSRYNYGVGLQVVFPIFDISNVRLKSRQQEAVVKNYEHLLELTGNTLNRQERTALNELSTSLKIAGEIPTEFQYSEMAYKALQSRYQAGLTDYSELIRAQYDLLNAEASLRIAYVNAWKSLLMLSVTRGDINIFLQQTEQ